MLAGQRLKAQGSRPPGGEFGPSLFRQPLPDAVLHRHRGKDMVIGNVANPGVDRQAQHLHLLYRLLGKGHAADLEIVELCGSGLINVFCRHSSAFSDKQDYQLTLSENQD